MHELSIVGGLAMLSHLGGWQFAAATVLGFAVLSLVLVGVKAVVAAVRRPDTHDVPAEDVLEPKR